MGCSLVVEHQPSCPGPKFKPSTKGKKRGRKKRRWDADHSFTVCACSRAPCLCRRDGSYRAAHSARAAWTANTTATPAEGILQSPVPLQKQKWLTLKEVGQWRKKYNLGNSQGKKIYYFNKSLGIERLLFRQRSKLYVRTMGSYLSPGLE